jgi:hypothetical protein
MAKSKTTAHGELDQLRQQYAQEHTRVRELEAELGAAKFDVERVSHEIADGYAVDDERAVTEARKREHQAVERVRELQHRLNGAVIRAERAGERVDAFRQERAQDLLAEAEADARRTTDELQRAVREAIRLWRGYKGDRSRIQQLVSAIEAGAGQVNGPPSSCSWERELSDLERALRRGDELEPPLPRWSGRAWRRSEDAAVRRLREERRKAAA